jgi:hypothetical protein
VAVFAQCYRIDRSLQPDEREVRRRVRIHRGDRGRPCCSPSAETAVLF